MAIDTDADSGLLPEGDAGKAVRDSDGLDKALNAALGGIDDETDLPSEVVKAAKDAAKSKDAPDAGDPRDGENARRATAPKTAKSEAPTDGAAPEGNAPAPLEAPKHWPADRKQAFAGLPPEAQKTLLSLSKDLEGGFTRKSQETSDQVKFAEGVRSIINDSTRQQIAHSGMDEVGYFRYLDALQQSATRNPVQYIAWAMQNLGVRPEHLGLSPAQQRQQEQAQVGGTGDPRLDEMLADPAVKQLQTQLGMTTQTVLQLQARLAEQDRQQQEWQQRQQYNHVQSLQSTWNDFRGQLDDHGQLAFPHADALMQSMGALMDTHHALKSMPDGPDKLRKAYDMAVLADPDLSQPIIEARVASKVSEAEKKREAERAKKATAIRPASGAPAVPKKSKGLDAALESAMSKWGS